MDLLLIIPYHNDHNGLIKTLRSIECERPAECLVIDDGSDAPVDAVKAGEALAANVKLTILRKEQNGGIVEAINHGLNFILRERPDCKFIARIDCGDQCVNRRLDKQIAFLEANEDHGIVGTWAKFVTPFGRVQFKVTPPCSDRGIRREMKQRVGFMHPTVMYRSEVLTKSGLYPGNYLHAEDYAYFFEVLKFFKGANLHEYLTVIEYRSEGISIKNRTRQLLSRIHVIADYAGFSLKTGFGILITTLLIVTPVPLVNFLKARMS